MYLPTHFAETDPARLHALMREHPLALLVAVADGLATADPLPLEFDAAAGPLGTLRGHVARANPLAQRGGSEMLAVFSGPQAYVSPGLYASKREHGKVVPTWNYAVVQARGTLRTVDDAPWLRALVGRLTHHHEAPRPAPWAVDDAPADFVAQMLRAIVGIEIPLASLVGKFKLSQNRSAADHDGVRQGLASGGPQDRAAAALMRPATGPTPTDPLRKDPR
ncbi:MAG: FMN-binding negative transcriptional regulator [Rubrivivax sp.]|nr:FMN-binding negative transcriptional regulator [Rubrivivax sp.]